MRLRIALAAVGCLAAGLALQLGERSVVIDMLGSVLYTVLVGLLVLLVRPTLRAIVVAAIAFAASAAIEFLQLTPLPGAIIGVIPLARLALGSSFDPLDLVAYLIGAAALIPLVRALARRPATPPAADAPAGRPGRRGSDPAE